MSCSTESVPWDSLPDSARDSVLRVVRTLADGFTGEIRLDCRNGGVGRVRESRDYRPGNGRVDASADG